MSLYLKTNGLYIKSQTKDEMFVSINEAGVTAQIDSLHIGDSVGITGIDREAGDTSEANAHIPTTAKVIALIEEEQDVFPPHTHTEFDNALKLQAANPQLLLAFNSLAPVCTLGSDPQGKLVVTPGSDVTVTSETDATSTTTGSLTLMGGLGVAKNVHSLSTQSGSYVANTTGTSGQFVIVDQDQLTTGKLYLDEAILGQPQAFHIACADGVVVDNLFTPQSLHLGGTTVSAIDTSGTLAANSDSNLSTQKAVKTYVDAQFAAQTTLPISNNGIDTLSTAYRFVVTNATASSAYNQGAVVVTGGVGIGGSLYVNGSANLTSFTMGANSITALDTDGTLAANADGRIGTQKAVKTYVDAKTSAISGITLDTDGTLAANSDTRLSTQKAVKTYVDTRSTPIYVSVSNRYISGLSLTATIGGTTFSLTAGTWLYVNTTGTGPVYNTITYPGTVNVTDPGIALFAANTHVYVDSTNTLAYSYDSYLDPVKNTTNYQYVGSIIHGVVGASFLIVGVANYTIFPIKQTLQSSLGPMIEEIYPMLRTFPAITDAGNSDLSINVSAFQVAKPWIGVKAGSSSSAASVGPFVRPTLYGAYRTTAGGALTTTAGAQTLVKQVVPAVGYGTPQALGTSAVAAYIILYEGISNSFFYVLPNIWYGSVQDCAAAVRSIVFLPELRATNILGWVIIQGNTTTLATANFLRGFKLNYSCF